MSENNGIVSIDSGINLVTGRPARKALFFESMTEVRDKASGAKIRVWRSEEELPEYADEEILGLFKLIPEGANMKEMCDLISSLDRVTAVELTDANGLGAVAYFEW